MADRKAPQTDIAAWTTDRSPVRRASRPPTGQYVPDRASRPPSGQDLPRYFKPTGSLTAYRPTVRDQVARWMLGDDPSDFRRDFVLNTVGSVGLGSEQLSVADFTPLGMAFSADETARALDDGNYRNAAISAIGIIPWGRVIKSGGKLGGRSAIEALPGTLQDAESLAMRAEHPSARLQRPSEMDYPNGVAADQFPDTGAADFDWTVPGNVMLSEYLADRDGLTALVKDPDKTAVPSVPNAINSFKPHAAVRDGLLFNPLFPSMGIPGIGLYNYEPEQSLYPFDDERFQELYRTGRAT